MKEYSFGWLFIDWDCCCMWLLDITTPSESPKWHWLSDWNCYAQSFTVWKLLSWIAYILTPSESPKWHWLSNWNCYAWFTVWKLLSWIVWQKFLKQIGCHLFLGGGGKCAVLPITRWQVQVPTERGQHCGQHWIQDLGRPHAPAPPQSTYSSTVLPGKDELWEIDSTGLKHITSFFWSETLIGCARSVLSSLCLSQVWVPKSTQRGPYQFSWPLTSSACCEILNKMFCCSCTIQKVQWKPFVPQSFSTWRHFLTLHFDKFSINQRKEISLLACSTRTCVVQTQMLKSAAPPSTSHLLKHMNSLQATLKPSHCCIKGWARWGGWARWRRWMQT